MESLNSMLSVPERERKAKYYNYALNLIKRDLNHLMIHAENGKAVSPELLNFISAVDDVLYLYKK